ncbi:MAG: hypothetical protein AB7E79_12270 [Rhodospirillaceae bacterium]
MAIASTGAFAQTNCFTTDNGFGGTMRVCEFGSSGGGSASHPERPARDYEQERRDAEEERQRVDRNARVEALNQRVIRAFDSGDYREALRLSYEQQAIYNGPVVKKNIENLKKAIARREIWEKADAIRQEGDAAIRRRDLRAAVQHFKRALAIDPDVLSAEGKQALLSYENLLKGEQSIQQTADAFAGALRTTQAGGLDFDATPNESAVASTQAPVSAGCGPSRDSRVVDACNVPSGLPENAESAIAEVYRDAPPGVSDRVRKAFQAVMVSDWSVAKAWFEDALNRDPGNVGLMRMVELADYTLRHEGTAPVQFTPTRSDTDTFVRDARNGQFTQPVAVRAHFYSLPPEELRRMVGQPEGTQLQLPRDEDIMFLFADQEPAAAPIELMDVLRARALYIEVYTDAWVLLKAYVAQYK